MALLNRPLTEDEARHVLADWRTSLYGAPIASFYDMMQKQHCAHVVTYYKHRANGNLCEDALAAMLYERTI